MHFIVGSPVVFKLYFRTTLNLQTNCKTNARKKLNNSVVKYGEIKNVHVSFNIVSLTLVFYWLI